MENTSIVTQLLLFYRSRNRNFDTNTAWTLDNFTEPYRQQFLPSNKGRSSAWECIMLKLLKSLRDVRWFVRCVCCD